MASIVPFDRIDGDGNHHQFQTAQVPGGSLVESVTIGDGTASGQTTQVADHKPDGLSLTSIVYDLLVGALHKLKTADGVTFDTARTGASDGGSSVGLPAVGSEVLQPVVTTTTSTVAASSGSATLAVAATAGFVVNATVVLEPGTARAESARITAVVTNTSVAVAFPPGGASFTHTANYSIMTGIMNALRQAPGATGAALVSSDGYKPTYRTGAVAQTLFSTSAAVLLEIQGSASFTIRIKKIVIWAQAGTKFYAELTVLRCTGVSAGTPAATITTGAGKHDVNDSSGPATINYYTAAAAAGAGAVVTGSRSLSTVTPSATAVMVPTVFDFSRNQDKALIVRGTGDVIEIFNNTTGLGTGTWGWELEYEADLS